MSLAKAVNSTPAPSVSATRANFDEALTEAQTITSIIGYLSEISNSHGVNTSVFGWLAEEFDARLERIEAAEMTMRQARA